MVLRILSFIVVLSSCTTLTKANLNKRTDYAFSSFYLWQGNPESAREVLPPKEDGGFIKTLETAWLNLLAGKADTTDLQKIGDYLESRKTFRIRREAKSFFYKETPDTYFPSEHEVIMTHLVLGFSYLQKSNVPAARVEAKRAAFYLQNDFKSDENFDSAALRLWLATLWTACGNWSSAQVDFRVAANLEPTFAWAKDLANHDRPPATMALVLSGAGVDIRWDQAAKRFEGGLRFPNSVEKSTFSLGAIKVSEGVSSASWYERHAYRNFLIKDLMNDSRYMAESIVPLGAAGFLNTMGAGFGITVAAAGITGGVAIGWYGVKALIAAGVKQGEILFLPIIAGAAVGIAGVKKGRDIYKDANLASNDLIDENVSPANNYRYVRFLPNWTYFASSEEKLTKFDLTQKSDTNPYKPFINALSEDNRRILVYFVPGSPEDRVKASTFSVWTNPTNDDEWILLKDLQSAKVAASRCDLMSKDRRFTPWDLPTWRHLHEAKKSGLLDLKSSPLIARHVEEKDIWSKNTEGARPSECRTINLEDGSEGQVKDCDTPRRVLCVRSRR